PLRFAAGILEVSFGLLELGPALVKGGLLPTRVDLKEQVPLFNELPRLEFYFLDVPGNARPDLNRFHRLNSTGELIVFDYFFLLDGGDCHGRQGRLGLSRMPGATRQRGGADQQAYGKNAVVWNQKSHSFLMTRGDGTKGHRVKIYCFVCFRPSAWQRRCGEPFAGEAARPPRTGVSRARALGTSAAGNPFDEPTPPLRLTRVAANDPGRIRSRGTRSGSRAGCFVSR